MFERRVDINWPDGSSSPGFIDLYRQGCFVLEARQTGRARLDDVVDLYQRLRKTKRWGWETDKTVANAVANTHPDLALAIWTAIVNSLIAQVKPRAYEEAAVYLRLMKKVYARNHRSEGWQKLLDGLRREHKAKRRLMGILDTLSNKKLVD